MTTRPSFFEPFLLSELQVASQVPHLKTEEQDVSSTLVKQYYSTCIPNQHIYLGAISTVKNSEMTLTKQKHPPSLPSHLFTKPKSIYKLKSDAIKKAMKTAELRMSQGLPLDDSCSINYLFSEIESQERAKHNSKFAPVKSVDPSANMRPDNTPDNKKKYDSYSFMTTSVSTIQPHPNTQGISHHKGYTIIQPAFKEHKNNINFDYVDDEHTSPHQPDKISVETKTKNRPSDSEHKSKEASLKKPVGYRKSKKNIKSFLMQSNPDLELPVVELDPLEYTNPKNKNPRKPALRD
ncbi:hypothetical protein DSO57_1021534 [Entomophthora muscae]|uniref:Uncharacterized protein n=1 Tax=Entomophthora muscae TaxID=34485 RepID=A0ACC2SGF2_9FUNG|nr:hypothetical protein DSO57_1021534 [Entomophthora muscae]